MSPRTKGKAARSRYMLADFTPEEKDRVTEYCRRKRTTISSFLAGVALDEIDREKRDGSIQEQVEINLTVPAEQSAKLYMFAHRQGKTIHEYVRELVSPTLEKGKTSFNSDTQSLRYYLSPEQHRMLKRYLKSKNLSARTYVSYLALRVLERGKKG